MIFCALFWLDVCAVVCTVYIICTLVDDDDDFWGY